MISNLSSKRKIAILAHALSEGGGMHGGKNLLRAIGQEAPQHSYLLTVPTDRGYEDICATIPDCQLLKFAVSTPIWKRLWQENVFIDRKVREFDPDVILGLSHLFIRRPGRPQAMIFRDSHRLYPWRHFGPMTWKEKIRQGLREIYFRQGLAACDMVFCQTEIMRRRLREHRNYLKPIELCPNAVSFNGISSTALKPPACIKKLKGKFKLFFLAQRFRHKNHESVLEMFLRYRRELEGCAVIFTIDRRHGFGATDLLDRIKKERLSDCIINVGPIPQSHIARYYLNCNALLLPTLLESFSSTYIEAMYFGTPILTSDLDFARAICGKAALYFDPWDTASMKNAILQLKKNDLLCQQLADSGRERLTQIENDWNNIARHVLEKMDNLIRWKKTDGK